MVDICRFLPQGNGHERDFMFDDRVYIMDVYNRHIYPHDEYAKRKMYLKNEILHMLMLAS